MLGLRNDREWTITSHLLLWYCCMHVWAVLTRSKSLFATGDWSAMALADLCVHRNTVLAVRCSAADVSSLLRLRCCLQSISVSCKCYLRCFECRLSPCRAAFRDVLTRQRVVRNQFAAAVVAVRSQNWCFVCNVHVGIWLGYCWALARTQWRMRAPTMLHGDSKLLLLHSPTVKRSRCLCTCFLMEVLSHESKLQLVQAVTEVVAT